MSGLGTVETLSAADAAALGAAVQQLEAFMVGPVATAIAARLSFWRSLRSSAAQYGVDPSAIVGAAIVKANDLADGNAQSYARLLAGLSTGELALAAWTPAAEAGQPMQLGIVHADAAPSSLGQWAALPIVVRVIGQVAIGAGAWVLANAWTTSRELQAQADKTRSDTSAQTTQAITALAQRDPAQATALANALAAAQQAANNAQPGILDQLASSIRDVTSTAREVGTGVRESGSLILLVGLVYLLSRRREKNPRKSTRYAPPVLPRARARRLARSYAP